MGNLDYWWLEAFKQVCILLFIFTASLASIVITVSIGRKYFKKRWMFFAANLAVSLLSSFFVVPLLVYFNTVFWPGYVNNNLDYLSLWAMISFLFSIILYLTMENREK